MGYKEKPKYETLACILKDGLKAIQAKDDGRLVFTPPSGPISPPVKVHTHTYMLYTIAVNHVLSALEDICADEC